MELNLKLRKLGHSKGVTIPAELLRKLGLDIGDEIRINVLTSRYLKYQVDYVKILKDGTHEANSIELDIPQELDVMSYSHDYVNGLHSEKCRVYSIKFLDSNE